jgi:putative ABC transport system ATP-binding protein
MTVYELRGVERVFRTGGGEVRALDGIDLVVEPGELVAVEGASGSGKSTLLQLLGALDTPTAGSLSLNGRELSTLSEKERTAVRAQEIGFVFQAFNLIPTLSAAENVEIAMVPMKVPKEVRQARALELLEQVGLAARSQHLPTLLSGGEQQRVAIARALANEPMVILADEPTGNLDSRTADDVVQVLRSLSDAGGVTVVLVTHAEEVARAARRRVKLRDGRVLDDSACAV